MPVSLRAPRRSTPSFISKAWDKPIRPCQVTLKRWESTTARPQTLEETDPVIFGLVKREETRQRQCLNLIASENVMSPAVMEALGSVLQNKSSEGYPGARYHSCSTNIDEIERTCQARVLQAFNLRPEEWGVNVQSMSCSNANLYVYSALLGVHDRMMSLDVVSGGHLSHGYTRGQKKISHISKYFETLPYHLDDSTGTIDYDGLEALAAHYKPKLIVAGTSAYSRLIDYARIRAIASRSPAFVMSDISHISGLIAAGLIPSPFEHSDVVTSSTAKLLRGPRGGIIFYRKGVPLSLAKRNGNGNGTTIEDAINSSVFPGHQSSPHNNTTAALAVALQQAMTPQFKEYQRLVLLNARALADALKELGYALASGGTDTHLVLLDLRSKGIDGARVERVLEILGVASNRNVLPGDVSAREPSGLRIGSPVMTARGLKPEDFAQIARFVDRAVELTKELMVLADNGGGHRRARESNGNGNGNGLERFMNFVAENENLDMVAELRSEIRAWVERFIATS